MSNIAVRKTGTFGADARTFVYADISEQRGRASVTLDVTKFDKTKHLVDGFFHTGIVLGKITATGLYGPYDNTATDGRETAAGFLWNAFAPTGDQEAAALWFGPGAIKESKLPTGHGLDTAAKTELAAWFKFF
nr:head decoration protein [Rhodococcus sp. (in: high G+C Gram-positive bacteria)]